MCSFIGEILEKLIGSWRIHIQWNTYSISKVGIGSLPWLCNEVFKLIDFIDGSDITPNCLEMFEVFSFVHWECFLPEISPHHCVHVQGTNKRIRESTGVNWKKEQSYHWCIYWMIPPRMAYSFSTEYHKLKKGWECKVARWELDKRKTTRTGTQEQIVK